MKQRKLFLGVPIPREVAKRLALRTEKWKHLPIRFVKERNLHVTVLFLGHVLDESAVDICERVEEVCRDIAAFDVMLDTLALMPDWSNAKEAKQLWLSGEASEEMLALRNALEQALEVQTAEKKSFRPHVTLGKVRKYAWQELESAPEIHENVSVVIPIESVIVYESVFRKEDGGLIYDALAECPLSYE